MALDKAFWTNLPYLWTKNEVLVTALRYFCNANNMICTGRYYNLL